MNQEIICLNLTDFRVCWHKMSSNRYNDDICVINDLDLANDGGMNEDDADTFVIKESEEKIKFQTLLEALIGPSEHNSIDLKSSVRSQSNEQTIGQIDLYNKYSSTRINDLIFEINENDLLVFKGLLKIHWNLNKPIQLVNESVIPINFKSIDTNETNNGDDDNTLWSTNDDSIIEQNKNNSSIKRRATGSLSRASTVYYKGREVLRPSRHINKENQNFIPSYNSVSAVHLDSLTTCKEAIRILFEKYHILNSPDDYSLYKILQTGEKSELDSMDTPLAHRLRMGPFIEDKIFIMEKGTQININIELENLVRLPLHLLQGLLDNLEIQENKDKGILRERFNFYKEGLVQRLNSLQSFV